MEEQVRRIQKMENSLNEAIAAVGQLDKALTQYEMMLPQLNQLINYYESPLWMEDYQADCEGKLPAQLRRGVLSEDAVYDFLSETRQLCQQMELLAKSVKR